MAGEDSDASEAWRTYTGELGRNLQRLRVARALSQEDVAYRSGLARASYQRLEKGESAPGTAVNPTLRTLLSIACSFDVPLLDLLPSDPPDVRHT